MKNTITLLLFFALTFPFYGQVQLNAPWSESSDLKQKKKTTLENVSKAAEAYFKTIDRDKKGSGLKPFKRWEYHWSNYLKADGTIAPAKDLWNAWEQKKQLSAQNKKNNGDWKPLGPFENSNRYNATNFKQTGQGRINAIAVDPSNTNTYYVGSPAGGIWKSTDAGLNWNPLTDYLPQIGVSGIAIHPTNSDIIYITTGDDDANDSYSVGVWKSTNGGTSWSNTGAIPGISPSGSTQFMNEIYINPNNPETILVATTSGVQKSTNGGNSWTTKLNANIIDLKMKPGDSNTWYAITKDKFYKSTDGGDSFIEKSITGLTNSSRMTMDVTSIDPNYIYIVSAGFSRSNFNGIYKSTDSGETFAKTKESDDIFESTQAWYDLALTVSSTDKNTVYVGVLDIWKSTDGGDDFAKLNRWNDPNTGSYTHADIHFLRFIDNKFFAGTDGGIYVSTDEGSNFTDLTKNLAISQFYRISVSQQKANTIAGGLQDNGGFGLTDGKWYNYHGGDGMEGVIDPTNPKTYSGFTQYGGSLNISTNGGLSSDTWVRSPSAERTSANDSGGKWITPLVSNSKGQLYAGYSQVYKLQDNNWIKVSNQDFGGDLEVMEIDPNNDNIIYVARSSDLYRSTNGGANFTRVNFNNSNVKSVEVSNSDSNTVWVVSALGVYKTTNINALSANFTEITKNLPSENKLVIKHHQRSGNNTIYLGTNLGVYYTNDDLSEWKTFDSGLPNVQIRDIEINEEDSKIFAATYGRGIFSSDIPNAAPEKDIRLLEINSPTQGLNCNATISPEITIKNQGKQAVTDVIIKYNIDGGFDKTYNWSGNITSGSSQKITIPNITSTKGSHILNINITTTNDEYTSNNSLKTEFKINDFNSKPTDVNTFNNGETLYTDTTNETVWEIGSINKTLLKSSSKAYSTKVSDNYPNKTKGYLYSNCYNLINVTNPVLKFKMGFDTERDFDYMVVEYSLDQGNNWTVLGNASDPKWYNSSATKTPQGNPLPGKQWTGQGEDANPLGGTNATIHEYSHDLSTFTNESSFIFRFTFISDDSSNEEGVIIDDLVIEGTLSSGDVTLLNNISISPNPSESIFNLKWKSEGETMNVGVFDITGKQVFSKKNIKDSNHRLDMSNYSSGIYLLKMQMNGKSATKKLILK
ncbi:T9SS type A sorting domain-containing protein [Tenacibaculum halocynthiae]|uniref:T9SS type A sorting domain-containing protein n=1 Tax=Tenacibaculum halocynthiae TaxID=1254437 RepID=UPI0038965B6B